jgi:hypothetical protein
MRGQVTVGAVVLAAILGGTSWAQEPTPTWLRLAQILPAPPPMQPAPIGVQVGRLLIEPAEITDPVKNAPYSAEIVNEVTQQLADGNRIERRTTGMVARDGRGRVRREQQLTAMGPVIPEGETRMVSISDPVAGAFYSLDTARKVATRSRPGRPSPAPGGQPSGTFLGGRPSMIVRDDSASTASQSAKPPDVHVEQLGTKDYEGVRAEGTRTIMTVPAGALGNARPIEIVTERWYSAELRVVVFSRRADPRFGETIYRLVNITQAEPDGSLFQVPADYTLEDLKPSRPGEPPSDASSLSPSDFVRARVR